MNKNLVTLFYGLVLAGFVNAQEKVEYIKYGDMDSWLVRNIKESLVIGGNTKVLYEIAPSAVWNENVYGCQFHPEKSGEVGLKILRAFSEIN